MTLWARRSLFEEVFDENNWTVYLEEHTDKVVFFARPESGTVIDLTDYEWDHIMNTLQNIGQDKFELVFENNGFTGIRVSVPLQNLPEDYTE